MTYCFLPAKYGSAFPRVRANPVTDLTSELRRSMTSSPAYRLLLVDSSPARAPWLARLLALDTNLRFETAVASTLESALSQLATQEFDIVLVDPRSHCEPPASVLAQIQDASGSAVLLQLTASDDAAPLDCEQAGLDEVLVNPWLTTAMLSRSIQAALQRRRLVEERDAALAALASQRQERGQLIQVARRLSDQVSHDFRTPLAVISQYTSVLRDGLAGQLSEEQQSYLDRMARRVEDLDDLIDDLLMLHQLDHGQALAWRRRTPITALIDPSRESWRILATAQQVELELLIDEGLPLVFVDREHASRATRSLVQRALQSATRPMVVSIQAHFDEVRRAVLLDVVQRSSALDRDAEVRQWEPVCATTPAGDAPCTFGLALPLAQALLAANVGQVQVDTICARSRCCRLVLPVAEPRSLLAHTARHASDARWGAIFSVTLPLANDSQLAPAVDHFLHEVAGASALVWQHGPCSWYVAVVASQLDTTSCVEGWRAAWLNGDRDWPLENLPRLAFACLGRWSLPNEQLAWLDAWALATCSPAVSWVEERAAEEVPAEPVPTNSWSLGGDDLLEAPCLGAF